ncbi:MAG: hypothetical protein J0L76_06610 [Rhodobacterales bacterium]|nr:hypothetical protein [Rhodobacterales bacterium]
MRSLALIFALLPLPALAEMPDWWREGAVWAGDGVQTDGQAWTVEIALGPDAARISYPSIPCSGTLEILAANASHAKLQETISSGKQVCISGGTVLLRAEPEGKLIFLWSDPASGMEAVAVLAPLAS